jgi:hypothetical protein
MVASGLAVLLAVTAILALRQSTAQAQVHSLSPSNVLEVFWQPVIDARNPILASVGTIAALHPASSPAEPTADMGLLEAVQHYNIIPLADATALAHISSFLGERHIRMRVMNSDLTSFDDVQSGPTVLIGGISNVWTTRLTSKLRFTFEDSPTISRIVDHKAKTQPNWVMHRDQPYSSLTKDYAIIARYQDATTGRMTIIVAGIGPNGTRAGSEFLTSGEYLSKLSEAMPGRSWEHTNVEAILGTQVIDGKSGPPQVLASEFW